MREEREIMQKISTNNVIKQKWENDYTIINKHECMGGSWTLHTLLLCALSLSYDPKPNC